MTFQANKEQKDNKMYNMCVACVFNRKQDVETHKISNKINKFEIFEI